MAAHRVGRWSSPALTLPLRSGPGSPRVRGWVSAHVHFSVAAELAEATASRPGSFAAAFVDALDAVDEAAIRSQKIEPAVVIG